METGNLNFWTNYMPHGQCYLWRPDILWLNVLSDGVIAIAYFSIPITLYLFYRQRPLLPFRSMMIMFSLFIAACGVTHFMGIWTVWSGSYGIHGITKGFTALISTGTAALLWPTLPKLAELKSPAELQALNAKLQAEIVAQQTVTENLKRTESQLRTFLAQAPDGIVIVNKEGQIEYANDMMEKLFGYTSDELCDLNVDSLVPGETRNHHSADREGFFAHGNVRPMGIEQELSAIRKDGSAFPVEISLIPIDFPEKRVVLATVNDISARKRLEEENRKRSMELAHVARLNTLGEMASGLAHELNQPLTVISHNCETAISIEKSKDSPDLEIVEILNENNDSAQRAGEIIRGLRHLIRKEPGDITLCDLNSLIVSTEKLIRPEARAANVGIHFFPAQDLPKTVLDSIQMQQVLVNLCRNAIESISDAKTNRGLVTIRTQHIKPNTILVSVLDTGPGIAENVMKDLFQPFVTSKSKGMGLGLSICRSIVENLGGTLKCETEKNKGTTFHIRIPVRNKPAME